VGPACGLIDALLERRLDLADHDAIDTAARAAGRDPGDVHRMIQLIGSVTSSRGPVDTPLSGPNGRPIHTNPDQWVRITADFVTEQRFDAINLVPDRETPDQIGRFAEVITAARRLVADRRGAA
jgi:hypothetical protein